MCITFEFTGRIRFMRGTLGATRSGLMACYLADLEINNDR